jgi:hypothetical protein
MAGENDPVGYDYEVRIYQEETEEAPDDDTTTNTDVSPDPGDDEHAGTPGPTDDMPGIDDPFPPGDDERAGTPGPEMPDAGSPQNTGAAPDAGEPDADTSVDVIGFTDDEAEVLEPVEMQVTFDPNTGDVSVTSTSGEELTPEEELAALEDASRRITDKARDELQQLEEAEAGGDAGEIAAARAQYEYWRARMNDVDRELNDRKEKDSKTPR